MYPELLYSTPFFIASISILLVALFTYLRRKGKRAWYLILLSLTGGFWAATEGMLYLGLNIETNLLITYLQYLGVSPLIPLALIFTMSMFGYESYLNRTTLLVLILNMVSIILVVWTNSLHHLVFRDFYLIQTGPVPMLGLKHGPLWWVIIGYHYLLAAIMSMILCRQVIISSGVQRRQAGIILVAVGLLWCSNAVYVTGNSPVPNMDLGPLAFIMVALSMAWGFFRYNLLDVLPVAKTRIFQALSDPILVLDEKDRVVDVNPAAEGLFNLQLAESIGRNLDDLLHGHRQIVGLLRQEGGTGELTFLQQGEKRFFNLRISDLRDRRGIIFGKILIFHDISRRKQADRAMRERQKMEGILEMAGAVCHDLNRPVTALAEYSELILKKISANDAIYQKILKLSQQTDRLKATTHRLMDIARYETHTYLGNRIIDIEKSSAWAKPDESR